MFITFSYMCNILYIIEAYDCTIRSMRRRGGHDGIDS